jgi:hypothetical protein
MGKSPMKCVFDGNCATKKYGSPKMKVEVRKGPKGMSLFATKPIRKGSIIAYYKMKLFPNGITGKKNNMYTFTVYTKKGNYCSRLIGDVYEGSLLKPKRGIPYFAYFSNEPSGNQISNAEVDMNLDENYRNRDRLEVGDTIIYKLYATRAIKAGDEIIWCYGEAYDRDYKPNC